MNSRLQYFDMAKGFGMMLIILGHNPLPTIFRDWVYAFHVPLFFIISGYFMKSRPIKETIFKATRQLLLPLLATHFICFLLLTLIFNNTGKYNGPDIYLWITNQLLSLDVYSLPSVWFLYALFIGKIASTILNKYCTDYSMIVAVILFFLSLYLSDSYLNILPFHFLPSLAAIIFLLIGKEIKSSSILEKEWPSSFIILLVSLLLFIWKMPIDFRYLVFPFNIINVTIATLSSITIIYILKLISNSQVKMITSTLIPFLSYFGRNSLIILCFHCIERVLQISNYLFWLPSYSIGIFKIILLSLVPLVIARIPIIKSIFVVK